MHSGEAVRKVLATGLSAEFAQSAHAGNASWLLPWCSLGGNKLTSPVIVTVRCWHVPVFSHQAQAGEEG